MDIYKELAKCNFLQISFEASKDLIEGINNPELILKFLKKYADTGLEAHNNEDDDLFKLSENVYQICKDRAEELGADLSKYPETLEELIK